MKNASLATGAALVIAVPLSSPTFAQTSNQRTINAAPTPAPVVADAPAVPLYAPADEAITQDDDVRELLRCIGPPPRPLPTTRAESERAAIAPPSHPANAAHTVIAGSPGDHAAFSADYSHPPRTC